MGGASARVYCASLFSRCPHTRTLTKTRLAAGFTFFLGLLHLCLRLCLLPVLALFHLASLTCAAAIVFCPPLCEIVCWLGRAASLVLLVLVHLLGPSFSLGLKQGGLEVAKGSADACSGAGVAACAGIGVATTP